MEKSILCMLIFIRRDTSQRFVARTEQDKRNILWEDYPMKSSQVLSGKTYSSSLMQGPVSPDSVRLLVLYDTSLKLMSPYRGGISPVVPLN